MLFVLSAREQSAARRARPLPPLEHVTPPPGRSPGALVTSPEAAKRASLDFRLARLAARAGLARRRRSIPARRQSIMSQRSTSGALFPESVDWHTASGYDCRSTSPVIVGQEGFRKASVYRVACQGSQVARAGDPRPWRGQGPGSATARAGRRRGGSHVTAARADRGGGRTGRVRTH